MARPFEKPLTASCRQCGKTFAYRYYYGGKKGGRYDRTQTFCNKACADLFQYRGGAIDKHGYRLQRKGGKYYPEHRIVMERHLGRNLRPDETIHHKDGNRLNNELSNLELWSSRHGKGQRVEDKIEFCLSFLCDYPELVEQLGYKIEKSELLEDRPPRNYAAGITQWLM